MYKILGLISIVSASVFTGLVMSSELKDRVNCLKDIHQSAVYIRSELEYRAPVLEECFKGRGILFSRAWWYISENNYLPDEALKKASLEINCLNKEDREIILSFAGNLSAEDLPGQLINISLLISRLEEKIRESENEYRIKGRLYRSTGALAGLGLLILLL